MSIRRDEANLILTINAQQSGKTLQEMEKNARDLRRLLQKIPVDSAEFKTASAKAAELDQRIKQIKDSTRAAKAETSTFSSAWLKITGAIAVVTGAVRTFFSTLSGSSKLEQLNIAFTTFLGSADKAKKVIADLRKFADVTPFETDQVNQAGRALLAFGFSAEELIPTLERIGDVASGTGKDFNELALIYGKAKAQGLIQGEELNQLAEAGIPIYAELAKVLGVNENQIRKLGEQGKIQFSALDQVFRNLTSEGGRFAGLMERQSQSLDGLFSTLTSAVQGKLTSAMNGLLPLIKDITRGFIDFLTVPVSETLEQERQAFNGVALSVLNAKEGTDERTKGIKALQEQYPAFLGNIDAEKVTNEQLKPILDQINQSYVIRIALQKQQEKVQPLLEAEAEAATDLAEKRAEYNRQLARGAELAKVNRADYVDEASFILDVQRRLRQQIDQRGFSFFAKEDQIVLNKIISGQTTIENATGRQKIASEKVTQAERERQEVTAELRKTYADIFAILDAEATASKSGDKSGASKIKTEAEAAAGSVAALRKQISELEKLIENTPGNSKALEPLVRQLQLAESKLKALEARIERLKNGDADIAPSLEEIDRAFGNIGTDGSILPDEAERVALTEFSDFRIQEEQRTTEELNRFRQGLSDEDERRRQETREKEAELQQNIRDLKLSAADSIANAVFQIEGNRIARETDQATRTLEAEYARKIAAAEGNAGQQARLQRELEKKKEEIERDAARKRKALAIKEALIAGALAVIKALPNPFAAIAAGVAAAAQVAIISSQQFARGGYTGTGHGVVPDRTGHRPVGVVHNNEWVSPKWMTEHPVYGAQIAVLESVRQRGFADGGYATTPTVNIVPSAAAGSAASVSLEGLVLMADEFRAFRKEVRDWQGRLRVSYTEIRDVGNEVATVEADAAL